ncbi:MAG: hypothetical protein JWL62_3485 [Hyphomicrobiales bacterium]|nr:hypothetical protein [Hyphomicrobiales bacterium]
MARRVRSIGPRPVSLFTTMASGVAVREQELTLENKIVMLNRSQAEALPAWSSAFTYLRKDSRYYGLVEDTIGTDFQYGYLGIKDESGTIIAVQPSFILDQDLLAGSNPRARRLVDAVRKAWPGFLKLRTLMVGCAAGEGQLCTPDPRQRQEIAAALAADLPRVAREMQASLVVLKEFPAEYRICLAALAAKGFSQLPSMPMTRLDLSRYSSFDDYLARALPAEWRRKFRWNLKPADTTDPLDLNVTNNVDGVADEVFGLYQQVLGRSVLRFEKLTPAYFQELGRRMPDKTRIFLWKQKGRLVAFSLCLLHGDELFAEYLGMEYPLALELHLYFHVWRGLISWAIANGCKAIVSTSLGYKPKLRMKQTLVPLDLYILQTNPLINRLFRAALPWLDPTRGQATLRRFPNHSELWPDR